MNYQEYLTELKNISLELDRSLTDLSKGFDNDKEIFDAIILLGFENAKTGKETSADYVFLDPLSRKKYISYRNGYVRTFSQENILRLSPVTRSSLSTSRQRLLFILRRALKINMFFDSWKKSGKTVKEFLHSKRGMLSSKKYGV